MVGLQPEPSHMHFYTEAIIWFFLPAILAALILK